MRGAILSIFIAGVWVAKAADHPLNSWCADKTRGSTNWLCAGTLSGMMDLNIGFLVEADGHVQATMFPKSGSVFHYTTVLNREELDYVLTLFRFARLVERPEGRPTYGDGGNWEMAVNYDHKTNHFFLTTLELDEERPLRHLQMFLYPLTWQVDEAWNTSLGRRVKHLWTLQPYLLKRSERDNVEVLKRQVMGTKNWKSAKPLLEGLAPMLTKTEWCGLVGLCLKAAEDRERSIALADIWKRTHIAWPGVSSGTLWYLFPVLEVLSPNPTHEEQSTTLKNDGAPRN
jgi:hypothetical protein